MSQASVAGHPVALTKHTSLTRFYAQCRPLLMMVVSFVLALLAWQLLSLAFNPFLIPPPFEVISAAIPMLKSGELLRNTEVSLSRVAVGFLSG